MKKLSLALVAFSTLLLTGCSSCLGTTPTPGEAAPQAEAPENVQTMVGALDSLLKAGNGAQFYGILANVAEKMNEVTDTALATEYLVALQAYLTEHQSEIDALAHNTSDAIAQQELPGLVSFFSDINMLRSVYGFLQPADDVAGNVADESTTNTKE